MYSLVVYYVLVYTSVEYPVRPDEPEMRLMSKLACREFPAVFVFCLEAFDQRFTNENGG